MERRQKWIRRWAVFFFLGTLLWSVQVSPQQREIRGRFADPGAATAPKQVQVPNLIGSTVPQARTLLQDPDIRLQLGGVANRVDPRPPGTIVDQRPRAGIIVPRGTQVNVWVAVEGPPRVPEEQKVPVPPVVNMREDHARQDIFDSKLQIGHVTRMNHDRPAGIVFRQQPAAGTLVQRGSQVALWVSLGPQEPPPERVQVPDLLRKGPRAARELLESRGLVLGQRVQEDSTTHREGTIMRQQPVAGEWVNRGKQVNVWIARRPEEPPLPPPSPQEMTWVPDLRGKTLKQARALLNGSRLRQGAVGRSYSLGRAGAIVRQEPPAGVEVRVGSAVNLWLGKSIPPWIWAICGLLALVMGYFGYRTLRKRRPRPGPQPVNLEAKVGALDEGRFELAWKGGEESRLELRLRARPELGAQDLEAPAPLIKRERREHE